MRMMPSGDQDGIFFLFHPTSSSGRSFYKVRPEHFILNGFVFGFGTLHIIFEVHNLMAIITFLDAIKVAFGILFPELCGRNRKSACRSNRSVPGVYLQG